jgi:hypothetical protein
VEERPAPRATIGTAQYQTCRVEDARANQVRRIALWVVGAFLAGAFIAGPGLLPLGIGALATFMIGAVALRGPERAALAGGAATVLGALFLSAVSQSIESCARFNRQPGGRCEMGDGTPFVVIALLFLGMGLALTILAVRRRAR